MNKKQTDKEDLILILIITVFIIAANVIKIGTVVSGSMIPAIQIGQNVIYSPIYRQAFIKEGEIIVYKSSITNQYIIHRVVGIEYDYDYNNNVIKRALRVKGDDNLAADVELVTQENYIGKVIYVIKNEKLNKIVQTIIKLNNNIIPALLFVITAIILTYRIFTLQYRNLENCSDYDEHNE